MHLLGGRAMGRFGSSRFLFACAAALILFTSFLLFSSPRGSATSITSTLQKAEDWAASKLTRPEGDDQKPAEKEDEQTPDDAPGESNQWPPTPDPHSSLDMNGVLNWLFEPFKLPITEPSWTDSDGSKFRLPENPTWTQPLGKRLCLVDIDTRPLSSQDEIMNPGQFNWSRYSVPSSGMMGHYLYAQIHGYDYKFVQTHNFIDRSSYWTKISALSDTLRDYEFVISIDADAQIQHPEIPFEWLLNRWNVTKDTALTMAIDPDADHNLDSRGRPYNNCGFVVAHNIPRTHEMLKAWASCPDEPTEAFNGCAKWKRPWPAEQAAFGEYIRYMFDQPGDLNEIPCDEANGFPQSDSGCNGRFVRHQWTAKYLTIPVINTGVMQPMMNRLHDQFLNEQESIVIVREENGFMREDSI